MEAIKKLTTRLETLKQEIEETKKRLPAHSIKPPIMHQLFDLEDEYYAILNQIEALKNPPENT
jgi:hypothetical protein